ncbi:TPA: hypothetical protein N0F65_003284, partial [Lagenidium giganteum]
RLGRSLAQSLAFQLSHDGHAAQKIAEGTGITYRSKVAVDDSDNSEAMARLEEDDALTQRLLAEAEPQRQTLAPRRHLRPLKRQSTSMGVMQQIALSPIEKWRVHGRFPFKILLHVLLLLLTLTQMIVYDAQNAAYMRASHRNWAFFFLPPSNDEGTSTRFQRDIYTINRTFQAVTYVRDAYFGIVNTSVANYVHHRQPNGHVEPLRLEVTRMGVHSKTPTVNVYDLGALDVGPFKLNATLTEKKALLRSLQSLRFAFRLRDYQYGNYYEECFDWGIQLSLTMVEHSQIRAQVDDCSVTSCSGRTFWEALQHGFVWSHIVVAVLALTYLILSIKALLRSLRMYVVAVAVAWIYDPAGATVSHGRRVRLPTTTEEDEVEDDEDDEHERRRSRAQQQAYSSWAKIPWALRLKLFNGLQMLISTALFLLLGSSIWSLSFMKAHTPISYWHRMAQGTALLLLWSCLVGYLEHNRKIYSIVLTLRWGIPRVAQFLVGVSPIFIGYALFGTIYFGPRIQEFGSLGTSMVTLFAVMNGDVILDTFDALHHFGWLGRIYLFSFISLFIYVVLNIFVAIVEEAFFATRSCRRMLDLLLSDRQFATSSVVQDTEISVEMVRTMLKLMDKETKVPGTGCGSRDDENDDFSD